MQLQGRCLRRVINSETFIFFVYQSLIMYNIEFNLIVKFSVEDTFSKMNTHMICRPKNNCKGEQFYTTKWGTGLKSGTHITLFDPHYNTL